MQGVGEDGYAWADTKLPGRSLFEIADRPYDPERVAFSEYHAAFCPTGAFMVRNGRYKLNYYVDYDPELFDLESDPLEERNLAPDPAFANVRAEMDRKLRAIADPEATDKRAKDAQAALIAKHGGPEKAINVGAPGATPAPV
jgi:choline-sulfatase